MGNSGFFYHSFYKILLLRRTLGFMSNENDDDDDDDDDEDEDDEMMRMMMRMRAIMVSRWGRRPTSRIS